MFSLTQWVSSTAKERDGSTNVLVLGNNNWLWQWDLDMVHRDFKHYKYGYEESDLDIFTVFIAMEKSFVISFSDITPYTVFPK
jgi:hypothetical protein